MQNHFNTVITQTPQIILECSEWIQYELEICSFPPRGVCEPDWLGCSCSALLGFVPGRSQRVRHSRGKICLTAQSTSAHQKPETEIFTNSYKELNSPSAQYQPVSVFCLAGRAGSGVPHWLPQFWEWFLCLTSFQHNSVGNPWHCTTKPDQQSYSPHQYYHSPKKAFISSSIKLLFTLYLFLYHL